MIARILAINPEFIVADEPTSSLDVNVQAQMLSLLKKVREKFGLTCLFISHDLEVINTMSDKIAVMYLGKELVEYGKTYDIFNSAVHPYTQALLSAILVPDPDAKRDRIAIGGEIPTQINSPSGCRFHTRCPYSKQVCKNKEPVVVTIGDGHQVACHLKMCVD